MDARRIKVAHVPALDGLRALAIMIVMVAHAGLGGVVPGGFGVTIFFFLSGYLITSLLRVEAAANGKVDLADFYLRRTLRIFPPLYITLALTWLLVAAGAIGRDVQPGAAALDALFLTNYAPLVGLDRPLPLPLWSLDVEEHFYLLFSLAFAFVLIRLPPRRAAACCAGACAAVLLIRVAQVATLTDYGQNYYWSHTRLDSILFGCCLALWQNPAMEDGAWRPRGWQVAAALAVLLLCLAVRDPIFRETVRYSLQGGALLVLFSAAIQSRGPVARLLGSAPLRLVALWSYTLYLAHMPATLLLDHARVPHPAVWGTMLAFGYAWAMRALVESPIAAWRRARRFRAADEKPALS